MNKDNSEISQLLQDISFDDDFTRGEASNEDVRANEVNTVVANEDVFIYRQPNTTVRSIEKGITRISAADEVFGNENDRNNQLFGSYFSYFVDHGAYEVRNETDYAIEGELTRIKRGLSERNMAKLSSEFDDSSDEDFHTDGEPHTNQDTESDAPSEALHDIEGSSDDDIFLSSGANKEELIKKLKMMGRRERRPLTQAHNLPQDINEGEWFSDLENDEDIERAPGSDDESFEMKECLKFANVDVYRKAFKDWSVRHGYQFDYKKNERNRVTAVCAHENCKYRIHASVIQGGPVFMV
ncbi:hypothetical protein CDL12_19603 [Handroanthus impetiginosus]|uniref:Transposase MuDR plant domain-containing protein n=1 Tax=Handroanthus impetiginosus TaxID=429701 RepID=A0A2G9GS34_9LAMI|nr:hypothetical protein CDL12_19603 [Handroanthus impetiginosus]